MRCLPPSADAPSSGSLPGLPDDRETLVLMRAYAAVQDRCSRLAAEQAREIAQLQATVMRLRGAVVLRDTALGLAREELAALRALRPDQARQADLARRVERQRERIEHLERACRQLRPAPPPSAAPVRPPAPGLRPETVLCLDPSDLDRIGQAAPAGACGGEAADTDLAALEASLVAADLVICQTGCASHGAYWRVQDHCRRTGKPCVLVDRPDALDAVVRIHRPALRASAAANGGTAMPAPAGR